MNFAVVAPLGIKICTMSPESVLSETKIYDWNKIAIMSPLMEELEAKDSSTYAFSDKSKANFALVELSAINGGTISQYCMYDALIDLARRSTNEVRRAYNRQAIYFLILSACKGGFWKSEEDLEFYLRESGTGITKEEIDVNKCGPIVEQIVTYLSGA